MSVTITCGECGTAFCVDDRLNKELRETGRTFYCPNGHPRVYRPSETDKLRERVKRLEAEVEWSYKRRQELYRQVESLERTVRAYKANLGKARKRYDSLMDDRNAILEERNDLVGMRA